MTTTTLLPVDVIVPTHNRADVVESKVRWLLSLPDVARVIVVADGCTDDTTTRVPPIDPKRVVVIETAVARGPSAARNLGIRAAETEWVALLDDDDRHPDDYLAVLADTALVSGADIVGAPWLSAGYESDLDQEVTRRRALSEEPTLENVSGFPRAAWTETPWLSACVMVRRGVFDTIQFDERYSGNYWREETDFFVSASRAGYRVVLTGKTFSWGGPRGTGGIKRQSAIRYEASAIRNNWRFLRKHGTWLRSHHGFPPIGVAQAQFIGRRVWKVGSGAAKARIASITSKPHRWAARA